VLLPGYGSLASLPALKAIEKQVQGELELELIVATSTHDRCLVVLDLSHDLADVRERHAHLLEHQKIRNIRRDPRVAVTIASTDRSGPQTPYLSIKGTARVEEGGAPELLDDIATTIFGPGTGFPPPDAPPGYLTHIAIEKIGGVGPWAT